MAQRALHPVTGTVQTTDATVTTLASYDLSDALVSPSGAAWNNCTVQVEAFAGGHTAGGNGAGGIFKASFKRISGTVTQVGITIGDLFVDTTLIGSAITIDFSGNVLRLRVNGIGGQTINWGGLMRMWLVEP